MKSKFASMLVVAFSLLPTSAHAAAENRDQMSAVEPSNEALPAAPRVFIVDLDPPSVSGVDQPAVPDSSVYSNIEIDRPAANTERAREFRTIANSNAASLPPPRPGQALTSFVPTEDYDWPYLNPDIRGFYQSNWGWGTSLNWGFGSGLYGPVYYDSWLFPWSLGWGTGYRWHR